MDSYERLIEGLREHLVTATAIRGNDKAIREAIAGLPLANPAQALREVEQIIDGMLAARWSGADRVAALEELRVPVAALCVDVERRVRAESHPLPPASAEWAAAAQRLQMKLASGYALGMYELCAPAGKIPRFKGKLAVTTLVHGLLQAEAALLWSYRLYQSPPKGLWLRVHALNAFATSLGIDDQAAPDDSVSGLRQSAREVYTQSILLATSNPYRFSSRELDEARQVCRAMAPLCLFASTGTQGIAVDADADAGPGYIPEERGSAGTCVVTVDVAPVVRALDERMGQVPMGVDSLDLPVPGGGRLTTSVHFLNRLLAGWGSASRGHVRLAANHALDVVVGMHALHFALAGDTDFATFVRQVHGDAITVGGHDLPAAWLAAADTARPRVFRGEVLDQSEGGYRMRLAVADGLRLRIGDLIGLAAVVEDGDERDWMVGVIRWLRHDGGSVLMGIELLRRTARAAGVRAVTAEGDVLTPQRAVELLDGAATGELSLLVTHPFTGNVASVEVALPRLNSDWRSRAGVASWKPRGVESLGPTCFRVTLARDESRARG